MDWSRARSRLASVRAQQAIAGVASAAMLASAKIDNGDAEPPRAWILRPCYTEPRQRRGGYAGSVKKALSSLKVIEVGEMVSAPYAAKLMADMGAEVIKVERPVVGDSARRRGPFPGGTPHLEKSGLFLYLNANKYGVTLDLARPEGMELLDRLVADADILLHNV